MENLNEKKFTSKDEIAELKSYIHYFRERIYELSQYSDSCYNDYRFELSQQLLREISKLDNKLNNNN